MTSSQTQNPPTRSDSKSSKKKKAKAEAATQPPAPISEEDAGARQTTPEDPTNGGEGSYESPYIKELYKYAQFKSSVFLGL